VVLLVRQPVQFLQRELVQGLLLVDRQLEPVPLKELTQKQCIEISSFLPPNEVVYRLGILNPIRQLILFKKGTKCNMFFILSWNFLKILRFGDKFL